MKCKVLYKLFQPVAWGQPSIDTGWEGKPSLEAHSLTYVGINLNSAKLIRHLLWLLIPKSWCPWREKNRGERTPVLRELTASGRKALVYLGRRRLRGPNPEKYSLRLLKPVWVVMGVGVIEEHYRMLICFISPQKWELILQAQSMTT